MGLLSAFTDSQIALLGCAGAFILSLGILAVSGKIGQWRRRSTAPAFNTLRRIAGQTTQPARTNRTSKAA